MYNRSCFIRVFEPSKHFKNLIMAVLRAGGGIGIRARLRGVWGNPWRFKSSPAHFLFKNLAPVFKYFLMIQPADFFSKPLKNLSFDKLLRYFITIVILWYVLLCLVHYFCQRPLWNDEECVLLSIKSFSSFELFHKPLAAIQVFPRLYLFFIQQLAKPLHFHLLALRLPSLLCMLAGFFLWLKRKIKISRTAASPMAAGNPASIILIYAHFSFLLTLI